MLSQPVYQRRDPSHRESHREHIHDLRNLFGVIASANHMLEDHPSADRRALLFGAIHNAALEGARLTTDLLSPPASAHHLEKIDVARRMSELGPMIRALAGRDTELFLDPGDQRIQVRLTPSHFDAALLELIANARAALGPFGSIMVRAKPVRNRVWIAVADTGRGMTRAELDAALRGTGGPTAHGTGLGRVSRFARSAHGHLHLRSRKSRGTVAMLVLPMMLGLPVQEAHQASSAIPLGARLAGHRKDARSCR